MTVSTSDAPAAVASAVVSVTGLRKSYGNHEVLKGIDLSVPEGSVFALLGANGAGKTTTVQILATLLRPDAGEAYIAGHDVLRDPNGVRASIGVTGQFSAVDMYHNAAENLQLMADLWHLPKREGRQRVSELLELFDLTDAATKPVMTFSGGMKRRLDLAMTLVRSPRVIFLDEPTTGLDPRSRHTVWETVRRLVREQRVTILLTTQYLEEADELAHQVAVLDDGQVVAQGTAAELKARMQGGGHLTLSFTTPQGLAAAAHALGGAAITKEEEFTLQVPIDATACSVQALLNRIDCASVSSMSLHTPDLDDVFFALTGRNHTEEAS